MTVVNQTRHFIIHHFQLTHLWFWVNVSEITLARLLFLILLANLDQSNVIAQVISFWKIALLQALAQHFPRWAEYLSHLLRRRAVSERFASLCAPAIKRKCSPRRADLQFSGEFEIQFLLLSAWKTERKEGKVFDFIEQKHYFLLDKIREGLQSLYCHHYTTCRDYKRRGSVITCVQS